MSDFDFSFLDELPELVPTEEPKEVVPYQITALDAAKNSLAQLKEMQAEKKSTVISLRDKLEEIRREAQEQMRKVQEVERELMDSNSLIREAEQRVLEEAHLEAEKAKEDAIMAKRVETLKEYRAYIDNLKPEWKDDAFDHQWEGAAKLAMHGSGLLGDEMGLGKTLTSIMYLDLVRAKRVLVITPSDTNSNFTIEAAMWAKHRYVISLANLDKSARNNFMNIMLKPRAQEEGSEFLVTINIEQLYTDLAFFADLIALNFDTIVIDEAHTFKNTDSLLFQRLKQLKMNSHTKNFLPMTGTFILNKPQDIWPALHLLDDEAFPSLNAFLKIYCVNFGDGFRPDWHFKEGGLAALIRTLGGRIVQRNMQECGIVLPTQHIHDIEIDFDNNYLDQQKVIRMLAQHAQIVLDADRKSGPIAAIALITRQRQANVWPGGISFENTLPDGQVLKFSVGEDIKESIKVDWVEAKVREMVAKGERVVVFSQFKTGLAELESRLSDLKAIRYDGDTDRKTKMAVKRDFDKRHVTKTGGYTWDIALCNFKTGGVGLNFTDVTHMVMLDEEWNPGKNTQAYKRICRMGQTEETHVWIPRLKKSIDTWMKALNDKKQALVSGFVQEIDTQKEYKLFLDIIKANYGEEAV